MWGQSDSHKIRFLVAIPTRAVEANARLTALVGLVLLVLLGASLLMGLVLVLATAGLTPFGPAGGG